ncbi:MAG TPA: NUDIX domain-containing protein [bacterium]|jgi:8-oxo-dGTP diphosphatase
MYSRPNGKKPYGISVKVLLTNPEGKMLLLRRSVISTWNPGKYDLPGGKVEFGERFEEGLKREVEEETGLDIILDGFVGAVEDETDNFRVIHVIMAADSEIKEIKLSEEHDKYVWADLSEIETDDLCSYLQDLFILNVGD